MLKNNNMKKILLITSVIALAAVTGYSQGLVSINLGGGALVSTNSASNVSGKAYGSGATGFYYELLVSSNTGQSATANQLNGSASNLALWTDSGVSGTSGATGLNAGKITSGTSVAAAGTTAPGATYDNEFSYIIVGWSGNYGTTWSQVSALLAQGLAAGGYFGTTAVSFNVAGGGNAGLPAVNLWGNQTGTTGYGTSQGLVLAQVTPEPGTIALAGLGIASLFALRRKK